MNCISVTRNITAKGFIYQTWHARALKHARSCATCKLTYKTSVWCSSMIYRMKPWVLSVYLYKFIKLQVCYHFIFTRVEARSIVLERGSLVQIILTSKIMEILKIMKVLIREGGRGGGIPWNFSLLNSLFSLPFITFSKKVGMGATPWYFHFLYVNSRKLSAAKKNKKWVEGMPSPNPNPRGYVPVQRAGLISQENPSYINKPSSQDRHFLARTAFFMYI